jgi:hypothetical protein
MQAVAVAESEHQLADGQFGAHVLGAHARHALGSFLRGECVHKALFPFHRHKKRPQLTDSLPRCRGQSIR